MVECNPVNLGIQRVETYEKDGEYFLRIISISLESNGDVFRYTTDGIKLGIKNGDNVALLYDNTDISTMNSVFISPSIACRIPCAVRIGYDNEYKLSRDTTTTAECIERHIKRCTIEELENELGCRLEIISEDD